MNDIQENKLQNLPKHPGGRPTVITPEVIRKLEEVFAFGGTDKEACFYAGIGTSAFYDYQKENPEFVERKEALKQKPILKARQTVIKNLDNPETAKWYLARKRKEEFSERQELEASGRFLSGTLTPKEEAKLLNILSADDKPKSIKQGNTRDSSREEIPVPT